MLRMGTNLEQDMMSPEMLLALLNIMQEKSE